VTINLLKELGDKLIDIHSQHQTLMLSDNSFQLNVIDSFAGIAKLKAEYKTVWSSYQKIRKEYNIVRERGDRNKADLEYYQFQLSQLQDAKLRQGEQEELEAEQELLTHAGEIKIALSGSADLLKGDGLSILAMLREVKINLGKIKTFLTNGESLWIRADSTLIELGDLAGEIDNLATSIEADPQRLAMINDRLDTIYSLIQKHRVNDLNELITKKEEIADLVKSILTSDERLSLLEELLSKETDSLRRISLEMSEKRTGVIPEVERKIIELLKQLGMPNAKFRISLVQKHEFMAGGIDQADFLFSANKQIQPENLARIASGGELSRVMLSLKSLLTRNNNLPTIIFDEIDSGVSGEVADKVGQILSGMGRYMQVVNITHLPQVASRGTKHYHVYKDDIDDSTFTRVKLLSPEERILEVARLLSGSEVTETAMKNARELLKAAVN
jgi:DNA repair protein RecN (Recombination protein N)